MSEYKKIINLINYESYDLIKLKKQLVSFGIKVVNKNKNYSNIKDSLGRDQRVQVIGLDKNFEYTTPDKAVYFYKRLKDVKDKKVLTEFLRELLFSVLFSKITRYHNRSNIGIYPNIVQVCITEDNCSFIMNKAKGERLDDKIRHLYKDGITSCEQNTEIEFIIDTILLYNKQIEKLFSKLGYCFSHGDLHTGNMYMYKSTKITMLDFGHSQIQIKDGVNCKKNFLDMNANLGLNGKRITTLANEQSFGTPNVLHLLTRKNLEYDNIDNVFVNHLKEHLNKECN